RQHVESLENGTAEGAAGQPVDGLDTHPIPNLPSTFSVHDFHGFGVHGTSVTPGGLHFHLTATINAENDIPLVPSLAQHPSETDIAGAAAAAASGGNTAPRVTVSSSNNADAPRTTSPSIAPSHHGHHGH